MTTIELILIVICLTQIGTMIAILNHVEKFSKQGYQKAIEDILVFKDNIYTGTVVLNGDHQELSNNTYLGNDIGIIVTSESKGNKFTKEYVTKIKHAGMVLLNKEADNSQE